jgi:deoxyribose-phosphate aldolase
MGTAQDIGTVRPRGPLIPERRVLNPGEVAARLEHRLYASKPTRQAVHDGCEFAVRQGLSGVVVRPEDVPMVGLHLAGTSVSVVSIPGWRDSEVEPLATQPLLAEARRLAAEGATDLGVLANVERLTADNGRRLADDVTALVEAMQGCGVRVRVVVDTHELTVDATAAACELLGTTGAWLVQGGWWCGARTGLSRMQLMRAALPAEVSLKWTFPVKSVDSMMICIAEGVDRFNGDPESLLKDVARRTTVAPLVVPVPGVDY